MHHISSSCVRHTSEYFHMRKVIGGTKRSANSERLFMIYTYTIFFCFFFLPSLPPSCRNSLFFNAYFDYLSIRVRKLQYSKIKVTRNLYLTIARLYPSHTADRLRIKILYNAKGTILYYSENRYVDDWHLERTCTGYKRYNYHDLIA